MNRADKNFRTIYLYLIFLVLLRAIPFIFPDTRLWGFNHLIFLQAGYSAVFFIIAGIALIPPFLKTSERLGETMANWFSDSFLDSRLKYVYRLSFIALLTCLFIIFAAPTHFLGDGYSVINNLVAEGGVQFKWSEIGIIRLMQLFRSLIGPPDKITAGLTFQIVSILSGAISIYFFFLISQIASRSKLKRFLVFIVLTFSGVLLLFFGYAEYYPIVWIFMTGHIYFALRFLKSGSGLGLSWLFLICGLILHIQLAIFIPAALYLILARGRGLTVYNRFNTAIWIFIALIGLGLVVLFIHKYTTDLYFEDIFLPLFTGKPIAPGYSIFSIPHLLDIFNEIILISPLLFLLLILAGRKMREIFRNKLYLYLGLASVSSIIFLFVIDPKLAMPRDWDLFSISAFTISILVIVILPENKIESIRRFVLPFTIVLIISPLPYLLTNLNRERSERYLESLIDLDRDKGLSSLVVLHGYANEQGKTRMTDSLNLVYNDFYSDNRLSAQALLALDNGDIQLGATLLAKMKANRFDAEYHRIISRISYMRGNLNRALEHIDKAIQLRRYYSEYYCERAGIYYAMNLPKNSLEDFREAYNLNNSLALALNGLAYMYSNLGQYDSSIYYGEKLIKLDTTISQAYYSLAKSYAGKRKLEKARLFAARFSEFAERDSSLDGARDELLSLIDRLEDNLSRRSSDN